MCSQILEACCWECMSSESRVRGRLRICLPAYLSAWLPSTVSCLMGSRLNGGAQCYYFFFPSRSQWNATGSIHLLCLCHSSSLLNQPNPLQAERERESGRGMVNMRERLGKGDTELKKRKLHDRNTRNGKWSKRGRMWKSKGEREIMERRKDEIQNIQYVGMWGCEEEIPTEL